ncbi:MAG: coproporphyrinogen III oxidase, partial [Hyphomicrobiales bacterium]|nr:coproporphyrinogen III oxidase [Hyphomicrobiales bacterium]
TRAAVEGLRARGVRSLNVDAIYGLPGQTVESLLRTLDGVLALAPDRVALFGYAHVPWMKAHQAMIDAAALPGAEARLDMARAASARIAAAGYVRVGLDHFAIPGDGLARAAVDGRLRRNFQGYVAEEADALIGLGASAIGGLPQGHAQNASATGDYARRIGEGRLATVRGYALRADDLPRRDAIERLMCDLKFDARALRRRHGAAAEPLVAIARGLVAADAEGLLAPEDDGFRVTERGRAHLRGIAARFDAYLGTGVAAARHSLAV